VRLHWKIDPALLILAWRLAINPPSSWWRDPPAILAAYWIFLVAVGEMTSRPPLTRQRIVTAATVATMGLLLGLFAWRQVPLTAGVLGLP
jgi:hypothetical protein